MCVCVCVCVFVCVGGVCVGGWYQITYGTRRSMQGEDSYCCADVSSNVMDVHCLNQSHSSYSLSFIIAWNTASGRLLIKNFANIGSGGRG